MIITGKQIIGSDYASNESRTFKAVNPETGEQMEPRFYEGGSRDVDLAAELAERDFDAYRSISDDERAGFLETVADEIMNLGDTLINRAMKETGLPQARLEGERGRTVGQLKMLAALIKNGAWNEPGIDKPMPERKPIPKPDLRLIQIPIGPVGIFGASNFPLAFSVAGGDTASALAAGCTVVVKGHPAHPGTSELTGQAVQSAIKKSGMPEGAFSLIQGTSNDVGAAIAKHHLIKAVAFTGSFQGGKALFDIAASRKEPIPVFAEMGSSNPVFILPGALESNTQGLGEAFFGSLMLGVGQFCTNPGLVIGVKSEGLSSFIETVKKLISGSKSGTMLHMGIKSAYDKKIAQLKSTSSVNLAAQGTYSSDGACQGVASLLTTDCKTFLEYAELEDEVFGPAAIVVECDDNDEMSAIARKLDGQLTATLHGREGEFAAYSDLVTVLERKVGRIVFNGFPTGVDVCPSMNHGGVFPATTNSGSTSVGTGAIKRFLRPVCYQNAPQDILPVSLKNENSANILRLIDGAMTRDSV